MTEPTIPGSPWHASGPTLQAYVEGTLDVARSASIEQHLLACASCRLEVAGRFRTGEPSAVGSDDLWSSIIDEVDRPRLGRFASVVSRIGISEGTLRVLSATPALRFSWFAAMGAALVFAIASAVRPQGTDVLLLVLAPLLPLVGVGAAYGAGVDPMYELTRAAPMPGSRIFLLRSLAVLLTAIPLTLFASVVLPYEGPIAIAWLLPALGLVGATLALSTWTRPPYAAALAASAWLLLVGFSWVRSARLDVAFTTTVAFRAPGQILFALLALAGTAAFGLRLRTFDQPDHLRVEAH